MRTLSLLICLCLGALGPSFAAEAKKPEPPPLKPKLPDGTPAEQVKVLTQQYDDAMAAFRKRYESAATDAEQMKLIRFYPDPNDYAVLFVKVSENSPNDPAALDALLWVVRHVRGVPGKADTPYARARAVLRRDYLMDPKIGQFCLSLRYDDQDPQAVTLLRRVLADNPDKGAQAQAAFALTKLLRRRASFAEFLKKADAKGLANHEKHFGKEAVAELRKADADVLRKESEALLERLAKEKAFAATVIPYGEKKVALGELADRELFEIRHLQPGRPAPEIMGEDIDGRPMKLSDFRGKVVLLDFWGHW
jgi:hypothetical protein